MGVIVGNCDNEEVMFRAARKSQHASTDTVNCCVLFVMSLISHGVFSAADAATCMCCSAELYRS